mmetsp:Transcript_12512/g.34733  ORF Transcript_12512/g.34733 Transcript_12512/m.34733 type:complete len:114 (+) Transcript_12512:616-957(+)
MTCTPHKDNDSPRKAKPITKSSALYSRRTALLRNHRPRLLPPAAKRESIQYLTVFDHNRLPHSFDSVDGDPDFFLLSPQDVSASGRFRLRPKISPSKPGYRTFLATFCNPQDG